MVAVAEPVHSGCMTTGTDTMASLQSCTTAQGTQHTVHCVQVHVMAHSKRAHSYFIPIHIRVPYIQYTCVFHHACAGRKCGKRIYFFFLPPFFSFFSFLGLSSCLPWGLYLADQAEKDSNSSCTPQHTPTPSDHTDLLHLPSALRALVHTRRPDHTVTNTKHVCLDHTSTCACAL